MNLKNYILITFLISSLLKTEAQKIKLEMSTKEDFFSSDQIIDVQFSLTSTSKKQNSSIKHISKEIVDSVKFKLDDKLFKTVSNDKNLKYMTLFSTEDKDTLDQSSISWIYRVKPLINGVLEIPSASLKYKELSLKTEKIILRILDSTSKEGKCIKNIKCRAKKNIFFFSEKKKNKENILVKYYLYFKKLHIDSFKIIQKPVFKGYNNELFKGNKSIEEVQHKGKKFYRIVLFKAKLTRNENINLEEKPSIISLSVIDNKPSKDFFSTTKSVKIELTSKDFNIK